MEYEVKDIYWNDDSLDVYINEYNPPKGVMNNLVAEPSSIYVSIPKMDFEGKIKVKVYFVKVYESWFSFWLK